MERIMNTITCVQASPAEYSESCNITKNVGAIAEAILVKFSGSKDNYKV